MKAKLRSLPVLALLMLASCSSSGSDQQSQAQSSSEEKEGTVLTFVSEGLSDYKILVPETRPSPVSLASSELSYFLKQSSNCALDVVTDATSPAKYISLGLTKQLLSSSFYNAEADYGFSGYHIFSEGENVYIYGTSAENKGTLYGVYDFLHDAVGYEAYAGDEYYFQTKEAVSCRISDEVVIPSFDTRVIGYKYTNDDATLTQRLRLVNQYSAEDWYGFGHSQINGPYFNVADRVEKVASGEWQDDWFANGYAEADHNQLCYTGGEKLVDMVANAMIDKIKAQPEVTYFMFGQQDNADFCTCSRCAEAEKEWGCNTAGLQIAFMNDVIAKTEEYLKENEPGREVRYVVFAYMNTVNPPVKEEGGEYVPYSDKVIPNDKLYFYFAPIGTDFSSTLDSLSNDTYYKAIQGWNVLAGGRILCYLYDINFRHYFLNFNNTSTVANMYEMYRRFGVSYMYTQGPVDTIVPSFEEARVYVESKLMWDTSLSYEELLMDFMNHYYGPASSSITQYWNLTFDALAEYAAEGNYIGSIYGAIGSTDLWTEALVGALRRCFTQAYADIASLEMENPDAYAVYFRRLKKIELTVLYLELSSYSQYFSDAELAEKKSDFNRYCSEFGILRDCENGSLSSF